MEKGTDDAMMIHVLAIICSEQWLIFNSSYVTHVPVTMNIITEEPSRQTRKEKKELEK